jgi:phosphoribosylaminoimidazole-succinocarboxamide synthase
MDLIILASGNGTNLQSLIESQKSGILPINILGLITNNENALCVERARTQNIPDYYVDTSTGNFNETLVSLINSLTNNLSSTVIVLAGWMKVISAQFINSFPNIINIHPALPGKYPGTNAIRRAYDDFLNNNKLNTTGVMVHRVIEEIDAGEVLDSIEVPILNTDSYEDLELRVKLSEKPVLISALMRLILKLESLNSVNDSENSGRVILSGKVRDRFNLGYDLICFHITNRLSSFDRHICDVPGKGRLLNMTNKWWMDRTRHIIPNHLLYMEDDHFIARKCRVIPLEMIVRGYMTGSTNTSLWTHYNRGTRNYCGVDFRDGYTKNQKLDNPVITPTTKGEVDELISYDEILRREVVTKEELDFMYQKAMELYQFGVETMEKRGLILVDTKYEFGYDIDGNIILIDEMHTCDSSRFWTIESYEKGGEPRKLDKDSARNYVKTLCDPYTVDKIPEIPLSKKEEVFNCYRELYLSLVGDINNTINIQFNDSGENEGSNREQIIRNYFDNVHKNMVVILSGSDKDHKWVSKLRDNFENHNIYSAEYICSAHKKTKQLLRILDQYNNMKNRNVIYITVAGRSNALSGVVACNTHFPVIACPPFSDKTDMFTNINSTLQMPSNVPVMTILEPVNVAISCQRIFATC